MRFNTGLKVQILKIGMILVFSAIVLRLFVLEFYVVPTNSMYPTMLPGDRVLVFKFPYFLGFSPKRPFVKNTQNPLRTELLPFYRDDIIAFINYYENEKLFVKRIIAVPGDTVLVNDSLVTISSYPYKRTVPIPKSFKQRFQGTTVIPRKGEKLKIDSRSISSIQSLIESEGTHVDIHNNLVYIDGNPQNFYALKNDCYFVLGDNYSNSLDSRHFGYIPENCIIGKAHLVVWSSDKMNTRWGRIGKLVH